MVNMYVDTRETPKVVAVARQFGFIPMALECGDYSTDKMIVERKKIADFIQSSFAYGGKPPRIIDQMDRIFAECERTQRIPFLFITGRLMNKTCPKCGLLFEGAEAEYKKRGQTLNKNAVFGALASLKVRYNINVTWTEQPITEWMPELASMFEKVDEGKLLMPQMKSLKEFSRDRNAAVIARGLDIPPKKAEILAKNFGGLYNVLHIAKTEPCKIYNLPEIGSRTLTKIKEMAGIA